MGESEVHFLLSFPSDPPSRPQGVSDVDAGFSSISSNVPPFLIGVFIGLLIAVSCLRHWFALNAGQDGRHLVASLRRLGLQYLAAGILLTVAAANYVSQGMLPGSRTEIVKLALWGLPWGLVAGFKWTSRRGGH